MAAQKSSRKERSKIHKNLSQKWGSFFQSMFQSVCNTSKKTHTINKTKHWRNSAERSTEFCQCQSDTEVSITQHLYFPQPWLDIDHPEQPKTKKFNWFWLKCGIGLSTGVSKCKPQHSSSHVQLQNLPHIWSRILRHWRNCRDRWQFWIRWTPSYKRE